MIALKDVLIAIDSELWKEAKIEAIRKSVTVSEWVSEAIKEKLSQKD